MTSFIEGNSGNQSKLKGQYEAQSRPLHTEETGKRERLPTVRQATEMDGTGLFYTQLVNMFVI